MTSRNSNSNSTSIIQFQPNSSAQTCKTCLDCGKSLPNVHGNRKRCVPCRQILRKQVDRYRRVNDPDKISAANILAYMEQHTPGALAKVRSSIIAYRRLAAFKRAG